MSERSPSTAKRCFLSLVFLSILLGCSAKVWSSGLGDQDAIVEANLKTSAEDRALAKSMAVQARARNSDDLGPLVKLWCDAAAFAPNPENLVECAGVRLAAVAQMSNPQPSAEVVRMLRARESLTMVRAALEIAGGDPNVSNALRLRLKNSAACLRGLIAGSTSGDCD